jgi:hypothetical protein
MSVRVQDAAGKTSPILVDSFSAPSGVSPVSLNTTSFPDGAYVLLLDGTRFSDQQSLRSDPFMIDNTAPVVVVTAPFDDTFVNTSRPILRLVVSDFGSAPPPASSVRVFVDGRPTTLTVVNYAPVSKRTDAATLNATLTQALPDGVHHVRFAARDLAGNEGAVNLTFTVDTAPPSVTDALDVAFPLGRDLARPGGVLNASIGLADPAGVAAAWIDLRPLGGGLATFVRSTNGLWRGAIEFPRASPAGPVSLVVFAADKAGNSKGVSLLNLSVDRSIPQFNSLQAVSTTLTAAKLHAAFSEPTTFLVRLNGVQWLFNQSLSDSRDAVLTNLRPGTTYLLEVVALDAATNRASKIITLAMPVDDSPPGAPEHVSAKSVEEGVVDLSWSAAPDNAGIDSYVIERKTIQNTTSIVVPGNRTHARDAHAPAGELVGYSIHAVDLGGLAGAASNVTVVVAALPHLQAPAVEPRVGRSDQPFHFRVTYFEGAGAPPENISVRVAGHEYPMQPVDPLACSTRCIYEAVVRLDATTLRTSSETILFVATAHGANPTARLEEAPLVLGSGVQGRHGAAAPGAIAGGLAVLALAFVRRRKEAT